MKKIFKFTLLTIIILVFSIGFIFRGRISLYINITKKVAQLKNNLSTTSSTNLTTNPITPDSYTYKDIKYKETNGVPLTLDLYSPIEVPDKGSPVIIYVHGGSWAYGDKNIPSVLTPILDSFREEGYSILSVSYELMDESINFGKQISDVKDSIRWVYKNKDEYKFNTNEIGLIGISAGAHLSLMAGYSDNAEFTDDNSLVNYSSSIKYILDFFGPTDLSTLDTSALESDFNGLLSKIENKNEIIEKYSPINYLKEDLPNTLVVHSKSDKLVPYENSLKLYEKSAELGNKIKLVSVEEMGHDLSNINTEDATVIAINVLRFLVNNSPL